MKVTELLKEANITKELLNEIFAECHRISYTTKHIYTSILNYLNRLVDNSVITKEQKSKVYDFVCDRLRYYH